MKKAIMCCSAFFLLGCASVPNVEPVEYVRISDLIQTIECELDDAVSYIAERFPQYRYVRNQDAVATLKLKVLEVGGGSGDASFVIPISHGTFTIGLNGGLTSQNTRTMEFKVNFNTGRLDCQLGHPGEESKRFLEGDLGLREWLLQITEVLTKVRETPTYLSYSTNFEIKSDGGVNPKFSIVRMSGVNVGGGAKLSGSRTVTHTISITTKDFTTEPPKLALRPRARRDLEREADSFLIRDALSRIE